ncbi:MAG: hypothetical protein WBA93_21785 [Microcoleaceae cyanobacterium]
MSNLQAGGFDAQLVNLKDGDYEEEYGTVSWKGTSLSKTYVGRNFREIDPQSYDAWGITVNYMQERQVACQIVEHLASGGKPVIVGGSDSLAEPHHYLEAGASAVVKDKSGAANYPILDHLLGKQPREPLSGVVLADGSQYPQKVQSLSPEEWPLPSVEVVQQCLGKEYWRSPFPEELLPMGSVFIDAGCDRKCDFCQTPSYKLGYRRMSPDTTLKWFALQKEAGAKSVLSASDQFLGRILFGDEGRQEILDIMQGVRDLE